MELISDYHGQFQGCEVDATEKIIIYDDGNVLL